MAKAKPKLEPSPAVKAALDQANATFDEVGKASKAFMAALNKNAAAVNKYGTVVDKAMQTKGAKFVSPPKRKAAPAKPRAARKASPRKRAAATA